MESPLPPRTVVFVAGILLLAFSGGPVTSLWPMWRTYAWVPLVPPLVYLVANLACPQPASWMLKVVLLHTFIILQVRIEEICSMTLLSRVKYNVIITCEV